MPIMSKQDVLHLHALLVEIRDYYADAGIAVDDEAYRALDIQPVAINRQRDDHQHAVVTLAADLAGDVDLGYPERTPPMVNRPGRYPCETCGRVFNSGQAFGGHNPCPETRGPSKSEQQQAPVAADGGRDRDGEGR